MKTTLTPQDRLTISAAIPPLLEIFRRPAPPCDNAIRHSALTSAIKLDCLLASAKSK